MLDDRDRAWLVELLDARFEQLRDELELRGSASERSSLVDVREAAQIIGMTPAFVYAHADELGVRRVGSGPRARLRFDPVELERRLSCRAGRESAPSEPSFRATPVRRRRRRTGSGVPLLPVRGGDGA